MCEAACELAMSDAGGGTIINVTVSPHHGMPAMAHTGAARAAVEAVTRELATGYGLHGISVIAVALGRFDAESLRTYAAELWRSAAVSVPLRRLGSLEEYGWLIGGCPPRWARRRQARLSRSTARSTTGRDRGHPGDWRATATCRRKSADRTPDPARARPPPRRSADPAPGYHLAKSRARC